MLYITVGVLVKPKMKEKKEADVGPRFCLKTMHSEFSDSLELTLLMCRFTLSRLFGLMIATPKPYNLLIKPLAILFLTLYLASAIQGQLSTSDHLAEPGF